MWVGHFIRHEGLIKTIIEGAAAGENTWGRPRMQYTKQIMVDAGCTSYTAIKIHAESTKMEGCFQPISG